MSLYATLALAMVMFSLGSFVGHAAGYYRGKGTAPRGPRAVSPHYRRVGRPE